LEEIQSSKGYGILVTVDKTNITDINKILAPNRDEIKSWRKLHEENLH
jgi:hypothetical protein